MEDYILISITILNHNYGKYILKMLNSIKNQSFKNYEIVILDDASEDDSISIINKFINENKELKIKFIKQTRNLGTFANREKVLNMSSGKYILFCDADDYLEENCLEEYAKVIEQKEYDRIIGVVREVDSNGKILQIQNMVDNPSKWMYTMFHASIFKKEIFEKNKFNFNLSMFYDDAYITSYFNLYAKDVLFIHKVLYNWVIHENSMSSSKKDEKNMIDIINYFNSMKDVYNKIDNDRSQFEYQLIKFYYYSIYHCFRYSSLKQKISAWKILNKEFKQLFPNYKKNPLIKISYPTPVRKYGKILVWISVMLEKLHLMPIALIGYHIVSKFYYFNI